MATWTTFLLTWKRSVQSGKFYAGKNSDSIWVFWVLFLWSGLNFFFHFLPVPSPEEERGGLMGAAYGGLLTAVKIKSRGHLCGASSQPQSRLITPGSYRSKYLALSTFVSWRQPICTPCYWLFYFPLIYYGSSAPRLHNSPLKNSSSKFCFLTGCFRRFPHPSEGV